MTQMSAQLQREGTSFDAALVMEPVSADGSLLPVSEPIVFPARGVVRQGVLHLEYEVTTEGKATKHRVRATKPTRKFEVGRNWTAIANGRPASASRSANGAPAAGVPGFFSEVSSDNTALMIEAIGDTGSGATIDIRYDGPAQTLSSITIMNTKHGLPIGGVRLTVRKLSGASVTVSAVRGATQALRRGATALFLPKELQAQSWSEWRCWYVAGKLMVQAGTLGGCIGGALAGVIAGGLPGLIIGAGCLYDSIELVDSVFEWYDHCAPAVQ